MFNQTSSDTNKLSQAVDVSKLLSTQGFQNVSSEITDNKFAIAAGRDVLSAMLLLEHGDAR